MKFGIVTPVVTLSPRTHADWEQSAGPAEIRRIAERADQLGYDYLTCSEHVAIPENALATRGGRYYDPAATLGFAAAVTEHIRLVTHVLVLPYHHPLEVVKRFGSLDRLSGGRLVLGVGVGSLEEEFDLLGVDFADRGPRFEDALRALRAGFGTPSPRYAGTHYRFEGFHVDPHSLQSRPPIWLGGRSARSLRRAVEFGDGWNPFHLEAEALQAMLDKARQTPAWADRQSSPHPFEVVLTPEAPFDLETTEHEDRAVVMIRQFQTIGATALNVRFRHRSLTHYLELLERFQSLTKTRPT